MDPVKTEADTESYGTAESYGTPRPSSLLTLLPGKPSPFHYYHVSDTQVYISSWDLSISIHLLNMSPWIASKVKAGSFS